MTTQVDNDAMTARFIETEKLEPSVARELAVQAIYLGAGAATIGQMAGIADEQSGRDMFQFMPLRVLSQHLMGLQSVLAITTNL